MKIENKDYNYLSHFLSKSLFMGIGLSKLLEISMQSVWICVLIGTIFGALILLIIKKIDMSNIDKLNFFKTLCLFIIFLSLFVLGLSEIVNLISSIYLSEASKFYISIPIIVSLIYLNTKNDITVFKLISVLIVICFMLWFIAASSLLPQINFLNYLPFFKISLKNILIGSLQFGILTSTPNIMYSLISKNNIKDYKDNVMKNYLFSNFILFIIIMIVLGVLGPDLVKIYKYPEYFVLKKISIFNFINNVENILSLLWIFTLYIYIALTNNYLNKIVIKYSKVTWLSPIIMTILIYLFSKYLFDNLTFLLFIYHNITYIALSILLLFFIINLKCFKKNSKI